VWHASRMVTGRIRQRDVHGAPARLGPRYPGGNRFTPRTTPPTRLSAMVASVIVGLIVIWAFHFVASILLKKELRSDCNKGFNVGTFHTTGLLYLIGHQRQSYS
jgi:hypothetical protein